MQHSYSDVLVMLGLGIGMWLLEHVGLRSAPLVLGLVLGPIAESNFVQGSIIAQASDGLLRYFFTGSLNILMIGFCLLSIVYSVISYLKQKKQ